MVNAAEIPHSERILLGGMLYGETPFVEKGLIAAWTSDFAECVAQGCINAYDMGDCESEDEWEVRLYAHVCGLLNVAHPIVNEELSVFFDECRKSFEEWCKGL